MENSASAQQDLSEFGSEHNDGAGEDDQPWHVDIPERVILYERIKLRTSKILGAGRGIFALDAIKPQEVIFEIPKPIFCIVGGTSLSRQFASLYSIFSLRFTDACKYRLMTGGSVIHVIFASPTSPRALLGTLKSANVELSLIVMR